MCRKMFSVLTLSVMVAALATFNAQAQATGGSATGTVLDTNGAAIANATVTLRSKTTGQQLAAQTTDAGSYNFPNVPVGDYTIQFEQRGFQTATQDVKVALNQESGINVTLQVAGVASETIEITAGNEALVQTESSQLSRNYETRQVQDLPIFNDVRSLSLLSPGVVAQGVGVSGQGGSVGGTRPRSNSFNVDGVDNNDPVVTGTQTNVIQDAISEVSILTNNYNAEFGTGSGGQFNTVTKTGTNEFHGSGFIYLQNQNLNATTTSEEASIKRGDLKEKPRLRDPRFGATLGGPIQRNKLFFFGAIQHDPISQEGSGVAYRAPTSEGLAQIANLPGASPFIFNLLRDNLILATTATSFEDVLGASIPFGDVSVVNPNDSRQTQYQINIDHLPGTRDQFRYRLTSDNISALLPGSGNAKFNSSAVQASRLFSATWVRTLNSSLVNELRLSYRRFKQDFVLQDPAFNTFPTLTVAPLNLGLGPSSSLPQGGFNNSYQIYDSMSATRGAHTLKFGGELRFLIFTSRFLQRGRGDYVYSSFEELVTDAPPTVVDLRGVGSDAFAGNQRKFYVFGQDDWKLTPNLTVNLGLRYEYLGSPRDAALQALNSIADVPGIIEFRAPKPDKNNFAPRVGFAYSPDFESRLGRLLSGRRGQSSVRANFSLSYYETSQNFYINTVPPQFQQSISASAFNIGAPFLQNGGVPPTPIPPITTAAARSATANFMVDPIEPYNMAWSLSYQRELTTGTVMELRYLHNAGRHLPVQVRLNGGVIDTSKLVIPTFLIQPTTTQLQELPTLGSIGLDIDPVTGANRRFPARLGSSGFRGDVTAFLPVGNSVYDGVSVSLVRRFNRNFAFTTAYTFSKTIDNSTNELFSSTVNPRRPQDFFNLRDERGLSTLDVPHRFVASFNYDVPFFNRSDNAFLKNLLGGWQLNGILQTQSGQVITPQSGIDSNRNRDAAGDRTIINQNGVEGTGSPVIALNSAGQKVRLGDAATVAYVATNPNAQYIQAGYGARATAGRNTLRTNGFNRTDAVFLKNFRFGEERYNFQFGAEVGNLFNQRIRTIGDFGSPFFGNQNDPNRSNLFGIGSVSFAFPTVTSPLFNNYSAGNFSGRTLQLRAKFIF